MIDDPQELQRRAAYIDTIRGLYKNHRLVGFIGCLVGVVVMLFAQYRLGGVRSPVGWTGVGIIAVSWALFVYVIVMRTRYVRAHPYKTQA